MGPGNGGSDGDENSRNFRAARTLWVGIGLVMFVLHGLPGFDPVHGLWGTIDAVELAIAAFTGVGMLLPLLDNLKISGIDLKFRQLHEIAEKSGERSDALREALLRTNLFLVESSDALLKVSNAIQNETDRSRMGTVVISYCKRRMRSLVQWLDLSDEVIRASMWLYSETSGGLTFLASNDIADEATVDHVFTLGHGLMSQCFEENKTLEFSDAPATAGFEVIEGAPQYEFHGLLLVPIRAGDRALGVLSIDRQKRGLFGEEAMRVGQTIANNIGVALIQTLMTSGNQDGGDGTAVSGEGRETGSPVRGPTSLPS